MIIWTYSKGGCHMSTIMNKKTNGFRFHIEKYDSAIEVVEKCNSRERTDSNFHDMKNHNISNWHGVKSYEQALDYMKNGYQPTVDSMRGIFKANRNGEGTRFSFQNQIQGFAPVVPLALKGVPNCMVNMTMKPIKAKVIDIYYDMTASCSVDSDDIIKAGQTLLGTVIEMERQGYRFNLYAVQSYTDSTSADMLMVKIKNASQPLDLKRISFPLTHTAFFRVIGFDWYSKVPDGKYRCGYGCALTHSISRKKAEEYFKEMFGKNALYFSAKEIIGGGKDYVKREVECNDSKN